MQLKLEVKVIESLNPLFLLWLPLLPQDPPNARLCGGLTLLSISQFIS